MIFLGWDNETKLVPASFSCILDFHSKIKLSLQNVTVLNAIITLHHNKLSWLNCFIYIAFAKNRWEFKLRKSKSHRKYFAKESGNRGGSTAAATSKMERFVIIVNDWKPLTIITKRSILDVAAVLDPPLRKSWKAQKIIIAVKNFIK